VAGLKEWLLSEGIHKGIACGMSEKAEAATSFEEEEEEEEKEEEEEAGMGEAGNETGKKKKRGRDEEEGRIVGEGGVPQSYMKRTRSGVSWGVSERVLKPAKSPMMHTGCSSKAGLKDTGSNSQAKLENTGSSSKAKLKDTGSKSRAKLENTGSSSKARKKKIAGAERVKVSGGKGKEMGNNDNKNNNNNNNNKCDSTRRSKRGSGASSKSVVNNGQPGKAPNIPRRIDMNKMIRGLTFAEQILETKYCGKIVAKRNGFELVRGVVRRLVPARKCDQGVDLFVSDCTSTRASWSRL
jgi:hypothetical protein